MTLDRLDHDSVAERDAEYELAQAQATQALVPGALGPCPSGSSQPRKLRATTSPARRAPSPGELGPSSADQAKLRDWACP